MCIHFKCCVCVVTLNFYHLLENCSHSVMRALQNLQKNRIVILSMIGGDEEKDSNFDPPAHFLIGLKSIQMNLKRDNFLLILKENCLLFLDKRMRWVYLRVSGTKWVADQEMTVLGVNTQFSRGDQDNGLRCRLWQSSIMRPEEGRFSRVRMRV